MKMYALSLESMNRVLGALGKVAAELSYDPITILRSAREVDIEDLSQGVPAAPEKKKPTPK